MWPGSGPVCVDWGDGHCRKKKYSFYGILRESLGLGIIMFDKFDKDRQGIDYIHKNYVYKVGFLQEKKKKKLPTISLHR